LFRERRVEYIDRMAEFVADTLAGYTLSQAIVAAFDCGLWGAFENNLDGTVSLEALARDKQLEQRYLDAVAAFLRQHHVLERGAAPGEVRLSETGKALVKGGLGPFLLVVGGYGGVLSQMGPLIRREVRFDDVKATARNGRLVALGTELASRKPGGNYSLALDRAAASPAEVVMDLGCGSAQFLVALIQRTQAQRGIGVEIDAKACELARETLQGAGLGERCTVLHTDIRTILQRQPDLADRCDVVTGLFVVHEFFRAGFENAVQEFQALRALLHPTRGRLVMVDKITDPLEGDNAHSTMMDFELFHQMTDQRLYTRAEWQRLFDAAGLKVSFEKEVIAPTGHTGTVVFECVRA
jgi:SAM-dependent methyltransferase